MPDRMSVLIAGLGSIGQRHARNLRTLFGQDVELTAYRVRGLPGVITDAMTIEPGSTVEAKYRIRSFDRLDAALADRPDAVIVCNPTSAHMPVALAAVDAGCHVLIEKPLADSLDAVDRLIELADRRGVVGAVGYQMRFHPVLLRLRELLCRKTIGHLVSVRAEFGEYLPSAHPYEDYRESYAARADLGGGVILCYIHEFDYLGWLFGPPQRVFTVGGRVGDLEIDVEDTAITVMQCGAVPVQVHQSFVQRPSARTCEVVGDAGVIHVDLNQPSLTVTDRAGAETERLVCGGVSRNQLFLDELRAFAAAMSGSPTTLVTLREAAVSLRTALAAKQSLASGQAVELS